MIPQPASACKSSIPWGTERRRDTAHRGWGKCHQSDGLLQCVDCLEGSRRLLNIRALGWRPDASDRPQRGVPSTSAWVNVNVLGANADLRGNLVCNLVGEKGAREGLEYPAYDVLPV